MDENKYMLYLFLLGRSFSKSLSPILIGSVLLLVASNLSSSPQEPRSHAEVARGGATEWKQSYLSHAGKEQFCSTW